METSSLSAEKFRVRKQLNLHLEVILVNKRIYFLAVIAFITGMVELMVGGILDLIANDLEITLAEAGSLITVFSFIYAVISPVLLVLTAKMERKRLILICLYIFLFGTVLTVFGPNYLVVFIARIIQAISSSLLVLLCIVIAPNIVRKEYRGRAIGIVSMGTSASLVLGIPIGIYLGSTFGWRAPFILITLLTVMAIIGVHFLMEKVVSRPATPLKSLLKSLLLGLKNLKLFLALFTTFLYMAGHTVLYAYFKPYLHHTTDFSITWIGILYFIFGLAAVTGGGLGGLVSDLIGSRRTIVVSLVLFDFVFFILPVANITPWLYLITIIFWGMLSWGISPAMQSYLIETIPEAGDIMQSLNNSALHLGIAFGSLVGGMVVDKLSIEENPYVAGGLVMIGLITAILSIRTTLAISHEVKRL